MYRPTSIISWKGNVIKNDDVAMYFTSYRNKILELISIDAQPVPDDANGTCTFLPYSAL